MSESTYPVTGMTCSHCVSSVTEEVSGIDGVRDVRIELATGQVTVNSDRDLTVDEVREAVTEAGYQLANKSSLSLSASSSERSVAPAAFSTRSTSRR
jgi:copper chaperone